MEPGGAPTVEEKAHGEEGALADVDASRGEGDQRYYSSGLLGDKLNLSGGRKKIKDPCLKRSRREREQHA